MHVSQWLFRLEVTMAEKVKIILRDRQWEVEPGKSARAVMKALGLNPESYLVVRNGQLVDDSTVFAGGDRVKLVAVISGGS